MAWLEILIRSMNLQFQNSIRNGNALYISLIQPILFTLGTGLIFTYTGKPSLLPLAALGSGLMGLWNSNVFSSGTAVDEERYYGTLELMMLSPTPVFVVLIGRTLFNSLLSLCALVTSILTAWLVFGTVINFRNPVMASCMLLALVVAATSMGMVMASGFLLTPQARRVIELMNYPIYVLSGFLIPLSFLPQPLEWISKFLPLTWAASALHDLAGLTAANVSPLTSLGVLLGLSAVYFLLGIWLFRKIEYHARVRGSSDHQL